MSSFPIPLETNLMALASFRAVETTFRLARQAFGEFAREPTLEGFRVALLKMMMFRDMFYEHYVSHAWLSNGQVLDDYDCLVEAPLFIECAAFIELTIPVFSHWIRVHIDSREPVLVFLHIDNQFKLGHVPAPELQETLKSLYENGHGRLMLEISQVFKPLA
jgi:hypothetical protein